MGNLCLKKVVWLGFVFYLLLPLDTLASVVINEVAWMGTNVSANDEWIELYNNSEVEIALDGWLLRAADDTPKINLQGKIPSLGFFLLERTDEQTVPNVTAEQIYTGALNNNGEKLQLIDNEGKVIDEADCSSGWLAGDNKTKQTMARVNSLVAGPNPENWQTSQNPGGTPKVKNSQPSEAPGVEPPELTPAPEATATKEQSYGVYPENIFINEILPSPEGPDAENEWIEIYNANSFEVNLAGWQMRDKVGQTMSHLCPTDTKIVPSGFLVLQRKDSKIVLQNTGDSLELINPKGDVVHSVIYAKAPVSQSYNRTSLGWAWSTALTPGKENIIAQPLSAKTPLEEKKKQVAPSQGTGERESRQTLAQIKEELPKFSRRLLVFLSAALIAIGSTAVVLFLKKRISE